MPHYARFNGQVEYTARPETIDPTTIVEVNRIAGSPADSTSRIRPWTRMEGRQTDDAKLDKPVFTHGCGPTTGSAVWTSFDWGKSIKAARVYVGEPCSGE